MDKVKLKDMRKKTTTIMWYVLIVTKNEELYKLYYFWHHFTQVEILTEADGKADGGETIWANGVQQHFNTDLVFCDGRRLLQDLFDCLHYRFSTHGAHRTNQLNQQQLLLTGYRNDLQHAEDKTSTQTDTTGVWTCLLKAILVRESIREMCCAQVSAK